MPKDINGDKLKIGDYVTISPNNLAPNMIAIIKKIERFNIIALDQGEIWNLFKPIAVLGPALVGEYSFNYYSQCNTIRRLSREQVMLIMFEM